MIAKKQPYKIIPYPNRRNVGRIIKHSHRRLREGEEVAATLMAMIDGDVKFLPELHVPNIKNPLNSDSMAHDIKQVLILGKDSYSIIRRSMLK